MIHPHSIQQILDTVPIDDLVGDYVKLKRSGSRFKGNCPFHDEKTPSFVVTPSLNIYKCFGCQKGGNSIQFLMEMEQMTFVEAARDLAKRYGITLMESEGPKGEEAMEQQRQKESLQALNEFALTFFESNFTIPKKVKRLHYLISKSVVTPQKQLKNGVWGIPLNLGKHFTIMQKKQDTLMSYS
jgi:DNA primase catalytic core